MNLSSSSTYLQKLWGGLKRILIQPEDTNNNSFDLINDGDRQTSSMSPCKKSRMESVTKSLYETFDQVAFMEVMKKLLTCSVCLEVRKQANQCHNGHLICINCTLSIQQSSASKEINCPVCRVPITGTYHRSLLAEQLVSELPIKCRYCTTVMSGRHIQQHESDFCLQRQIDCQYSLFGCKWKGVAKEKSNHEIICDIGLSTVASVSGVVNSNLKKQLKRHEKRYFHWNSLVNKLRERNISFKLLLKQLVVTKYKSCKYKTAKLYLLNQHFIVKLKFNIDKKNSNNYIYYKLKYSGKEKLSFYFFLNSLRFDDDIYQIDDNMHYFSFSETDTVAGYFNLSLSKSINDEENIVLHELLVEKDSLYLELIINMENYESLDNSIVFNTSLDSSNTISQAINSSRNGLSSSNAGNLVVALISPNLQNQNTTEEESEEQDDADAEDENENNENEEDEAEEAEEAEEADEEGNNGEEIEENVAEP